jgi:hypothetical protein
MAAADSMATLINRCRQRGGLMKVTLGELRTALNYSRLGRYVLEEITDNLVDAGVGFFPAATLDPEKNIQPRADQAVWIYLQDDSLRARVLDAVTSPDDYDVAVVLAPLSKEEQVSLTPTQKLDRIRAILAD